MSTFIQNNLLVSSQTVNNNNNNIKNDSALPPRLQKESDDQYFYRLLNQFDDGELTIPQEVALFEMAKTKGRWEQSATDTYNGKQLAGDFSDEYYREKEEYLKTLSHSNKILNERHVSQNESSGTDNTAQQQISKKIDSKQDEIKIPVQGDNEQWDEYWKRLTPEQQAALNSKFTSETYQYEKAGNGNGNGDEVPRSILSNDGVRADLGFLAPHVKQQIQHNEQLIKEEDKKYEAELRVALERSMNQEPVQNAPKKEKVNPHNPSVQHQNNSHVLPLHPVNGDVSEVLKLSEETAKLDEEDRQNLKKAIIETAVDKILSSKNHRNKMSKWREGWVNLWNRFAGAPRLRASRIKQRTGDFVAGKLEPQDAIRLLQDLERHPRKFTEAQSRKIRESEQFQHMKAAAGKAISKENTFLCQEFSPQRDSDKVKKHMQSVEHEYHLRLVKAVSHFDHSINSEFNNLLQSEDTLRSLMRSV